MRLLLSNIKDVFLETERFTCFIPKKKKKNYKHITTEFFAEDEDLRMNWSLILSPHIAFIISIKNVGFWHFECRPISVQPD